MAARIHQHLAKRGTGEEPETCRVSNTIGTVVRRLQRTGRGVRKAHAQLEITCVGRRTPVCESFSFLLCF